MPKKKNQRYYSCQPPGFNFRKKNLKVQLPAVRVPMPKKKNYIYSCQLPGFQHQRGRIIYTATSCRDSPAEEGN
jgi:hypothetical protein